MGMDHSHHLRCSHCGTALLNYDFQKHHPGAKQTEGSQISCSRCRKVLEGMSNLLGFLGHSFSTGSEAFGGRRDGEWEDELTGECGGIGWYQKDPLPLELIVINGSD